MAEHCPTCGAAVDIVNGDEGTSHYVPAITEDMVTAAARSLGYSGYAITTGSVRAQVRAALFNAAVETHRTTS